MVWLEFFICAILILISGSLLSRYADVLAEKTRMGRTWIGLILLATVTSLPELGTGLSAVTVADAPDLAVGDVLGACVINLLLIGLIDLFCRPVPLLTRVDRGQILPAAFGVLLIGMVAWGLFLGTTEVRYWNLWFGPYTPAILITYVLAMRIMFHSEKKRMARGNVEVVLQYQDVSTGRAYVMVFLHGSVVMLAGLWLPFIGNRIVEVTGWGTTFVGSLFMAAATTLPEIVTSIAALRLAALDLAVANLFGSNLINMAVLAITDLAYAGGPLLFHVSPYHLFSAMTAVMMTGVAIAGIIFRGRKKLWGPVSWPTLILLAFYLLNAVLIFTLTKSN